MRARSGRRPAWRAPILALGRALAAAALLTGAAAAQTGAETGAQTEAPPPAPGAAPPVGPDWYGSAEAALRARLAYRPIEGRARNVILMIGDGAGVAAMTATRLFAGQREGGLGEEMILAPELFPHSALVKTYTANAQTGDGAATATALMSGVKTKSGVLGLDQTAIRGQCGSGARLDRLGDLFHRDGRAVGYVTTARITHATPAAGYATLADRLWEHDALTPARCLQHDVAFQLAERMARGEVQVAMGGGRARFFPEGQTDSEGLTGLRQDGRNLLNMVRDVGGRTPFSLKELLTLDLASGAPILGLFASNSMLYEYDRIATGAAQPSLAEMTEAAIAALEASGGGRGYFLMVEGGRIGQAGHYGNLRRLVEDGAAFSAAVAKAAALTDPRDTLIVVTADAAQALTFNGYCGRGSPVPGLCYGIDPEGPGHAPEPALAADGAPYETAGFLNGPGAAIPDEAVPDEETGAAPGPAPSRESLTPETAADPNRRQAALVPMETQTGAATDAPAYARGPWAHLIDGVVEQHYLFHVMRYAAGLPTGRGLSAAAEPAEGAAAAQ